MGNEALIERLLYEADAHSRNNVYQSTVRVLREAAVALKAAEVERDEAQRNYERKCDDCAVQRLRAENAEALIKVKWGAGSMVAAALDRAERAETDLAAGRAEASRAFDEAEEAYKRVAEIAGERDAARAEIERLMDGLRPFAEYMEGGMDRDDKGAPLPDEQGVGWIDLTYADFRRARALLSEAGKAT